MIARYLLANRHIRASHETDGVKLPLVVLV
ncbi:hypothetical protein PS914_01836 [Pseudomonas fluorescens]|uniref:Uncharacterized protein n=1 Tax=Pseudomonas fluorescens TaxID=294 RepID=A0A5E7FH42_PSEFL|nr:hypothetical protein PS833_05599 [Pseudomonas fluorescens]VVP77097.1 hypothetical protein PS914_01836 [Pseudomonas fluorescens]